MGYLHIDNLYKDKQILQFKRIYALEKIHGTSAHVGWDQGQLSFFSGGESHDRFVALFDKPALHMAFAERFGHGFTDESVVVYGEAYGGKQQKMSATYGPDLKFIAFDVRVGDSWLQVEQAHRVVEGLGLEFVDYEQIEATIEAIDAERDKPSTQARRNGILEDKIREGVVLRPVFEVTLNDGSRLIAKHKRDEFRETGSPRPTVTGEKAEMMMRAGLIAEEWATANRFDHVIDQLIRERDDKDIHMQDIPALNRLMVADILREGAGEILIEENALSKAVGPIVVKFLKTRLKEALKDV